MQPPPSIDANDYIQDLGTRLELIGLNLDKLKPLQFDPLTGKSLEKVLEGYRRQLDNLDNLVKSVTVDLDASRFERGRIAFRFALKEKKIRETGTLLSEYNNAILLHVLTYSTRLVDHSSQGGSKIAPFSYNLPFRNPRFVGQKGYLSAISKAITNANTSPAKIALVGIGGAGKTSIAVEYCYRAMNMFAAVLWMNAESERTIRESVEAVTNILPGHQKTFSSYDERIQYLSKYLQGTKKPWLLVWDNMDNMESDRFIPPFRTAFSRRQQKDVVLTTSRDPKVENYQSIKVNSMRGSDAIELFQTILGKGDTKQIEATNALVHKLGHLPLAIAQMAGFIKSSQRSMDSVLKEFDNSRIGNLFELGIVELEKDREIGVLLSDFLCQSSYFHPDGVSENFFKFHYYQCQESGTVVPEFFNLFLNEGCWDEFRYQDAVTKLSSQGFTSLHRGGDQGVTFYMHRLLQVRNPQTVSRMTETFSTGLTI
jgi:hypothetical protein